jgi:hypothetical protein
MRFYWFKSVLAPVVLAAVLWGGAATAQSVGFSSGGPSQAGRTDLLGVWVHAYLADTGDGTLRRLWQTFEIFDDSLSVHAYFFSDPQTVESQPFSRVISIWQAGTYTDPQAEKGVFDVIRFTPQVYSNLIPGTTRYRHLRGSFASQFRRFTFSPEFDQLRLSELVVLEFPVDQVRSFPDEALFTTFRRAGSLASVIESVSWGRLKNLGQWPVAD